jgi:hypothetical protein
MADTIEISVADLLFDVQNPRLASPNQGQRETLRALATGQGAKLRALAEDIIAYGLDPSELMIVTASVGDQDNRNRYIVLDGNRRLAALRALENPDSIAGAIPASVLKAIRRLSQVFQTAPMESTTCVVFKDHEEARHWIELRHTVNYAIRGSGAGQGQFPGVQMRALAFSREVISQRRFKLRL